MLASVLVFLLFTFWFLLGIGLVTLLHSRANLTRNLLMAPAVGVGVHVLLIFTLNRAGLPVKTFAAVLGLVLVATAALLLWRTRPVWPVRSYLPFAAILIAAFFFTGRPLLEFGFNWVSYCNDDMGNYTLSAQRFANHGFFEKPDPARLLSGREESLNYWYFYAVNGSRSGSELILAWTASIFNLNTLQVFMPVILALHLVLLSSLAAMMYDSKRARLSALLTCLLAACSALITLGTLYQLIAQVFGLSIMCVGAALLARSFGPKFRPRVHLRHALLSGIILAALVIAYSEVLPFLVLALGLTLLIRCIKGDWKPLLAVYSCAAVVTLILLNTWLPPAINYVEGQAIGKFSKALVENAMFPYYLVPSGLANLWGFLPINEDAREPLLSIGIAAGALLVVLALTTGLWQLRKGRAAACMAVIMLLLGFRLFQARSDFGLFKLAMYAQPFLIGTVVYGWLSIARRIPMRKGSFALQVVPLLLLGALGLRSQYSYVVSSRGELEGSLAEVVHASRLGLVDELIRTNRDVGAKPVMSDTSNITVAKFQGLSFAGKTLIQPSRDFYRRISVTAHGSDFLRKIGINMRSADSLTYALALQKQRETARATSTFVFRYPDADEIEDEFDAQNRVASFESTKDDSVFLESGPIQNLLNRRRFSPGFPGEFRLRSKLESHDMLIFIHSDLGENYFVPLDRKRVSFYQLEKDVTYPERTMAGIGRYFLFNVVNPTRASRIVLNITTTFNGDGKNLLPEARVFGNGSTLFPTTGRGSARLISDPIEPQIIQGLSYAAVDLGREGTRFPAQRPGLMRWYGTDVPLDARYLTGFARDISAISEDEYGSMAAPLSVSKFPGDLANDNLEYSGIYEDGWASEHCYVKLLQAEAVSQLVIRGEVPVIGNPQLRSQLTVRVDGNVIATTTLSPGRFEIKDNVAGARLSRRKVELTFSALQPLPGNDRRPVAAKLLFVGFADDRPVRQDITGPNGPVTLGQGWYPFETYQGQQFRWVADKAEFVVRPEVPAHARIRMDVEPGPGLGGRRLELSILDSSSHTVKSFSIGQRQDIAFDIPATRGKPRDFRMEIHGGGAKTTADARILNVRVFDVDVVSDAVQITSNDIVGQDLRLLDGWYDLETNQGERFRWARNGAELEIPTTTKASRLMVDLEPGPGASGRAFGVSLNDRNGVAIFHSEIRRRTVLTVPIASSGSSPGNLWFHVDDRLIHPAPHDPRHLSFRVFRVALQ